MKWFDKITSLFKEAPLSKDAFDKQAEELKDDVCYVQCGQCRWCRLIAKRP